MKKLNKVQIAELFGTTSQNISSKSKKNPQQFEVIELGVICKKYNIDKETLYTFIQSRNNSLQE